MRICITGGPKTGKTTLAEQLRVEVMDSGVRLHVSLRHTDDLISLGWSEASEAASRWFDEPGPWIVEGVAVSRALRKWRDRNPGEPPPVDRVIYLTEAHCVMLPGQRTMTQGVHTVHDELHGWLTRHGIQTERMSTAAGAPYDGAWA